MSQVGDTFFTSIGCMDGRVQAPIEEYGQKRYGAEYPDTITEAGLVGQLAKKDLSSDLFEAVKKKVLISVEKHNSKGILVHGHQNCAGHPIEDEQHKEDTLTTTAVVRSMVNEDVEVKPLFVVRNGDSWEVTEL